MEPSAAAPALSQKQRLTLLAVTVSGHAFKHVFNSALFLLLPEIKAGLGLSNVQVGLLSAIRNIASGAANLPAGFIADRFTRHGAVILGVSFALIGVFAFALGKAPSYWPAVAAVMLMVASITFWHPAAISSLSRHFATRRGLAIGLHGTGGSLGEAAGPVLVGFLLVFLTWRVILQGSLVLAVLVGGAVLLLLRRVPFGRDSVTSVADYLSSLRRLLGSRRLVLVLLLAGGFAGAQSVIFTFLPIYLDEVLEVSTLVRGLYMSLAQVGGVGAQPAMGYLSDRLGRKKVLAPGLFLLGLTTLGLSVAPPGWPFALVVLMMGAVSFSLMAILLAAATDLVEPSVQATTVSLVFASAVAVSGVSPFVAGLLADAVSVKAAFVFASGLATTTALVAATTRWQRTAA